MFSQTDIHTVASLLKSYLRELPEPVVPFHMYHALIEAAKAMGAAKQNSSSSSEELNDQAIDVIKPQLEQLPEENLHLLWWVAAFVIQLQHAYSEILVILQRYPQWCHTLCVRYYLDIAPITISLLLKRY